VTVAVAVEHGKPKHGHEGARRFGERRSPTSPAGGRALRVGSSDDDCCIADRAGWPECCTPTLVAASGTPKRTTDRSQRSWLVVDPRLAPCWRRRATAHPTWRWSRSHHRRLSSPPAWSLDVPCASK